MKKIPAPRGIRNNNPLNIRKGNNWQGERHPQSDRDFEEFETMQMGLRAALILLRNYMSGFSGKSRKFDTIEKIVRRWAPEVENATQSYINFVCDDTGFSRSDIIKFSEREKVCKIVSAMAFVECGCRISPEEIESAYDLLV